MADGTVSNHETIIATKGTPHVAKAKPSTADFCFDIQKKPTVHGDNEANTFQLNTGKTTKTLILGQPVWTEKGWIDEAPSWPAHAGVGGGVNLNVGRKGLNYIQYIYAASWSSDVKVEDGGVVRTDDTTKQNGGNCGGYVDGSNLKNWNDPTTDLMKKKCTIKKVEGECKHGRKLGAPPNADKGADGFYLDVLGGDTVTLKAERKDVTDPGNEKPAGKCAASGATHTHWIANRKGTDGHDARADYSGEVFKVQGDVLVDPIDDSWTPGGKSLSNALTAAGGKDPSEGAKAAAETHDNSVSNQQLARDLTTAPANGAKSPYYSPNAPTSGGSTNVSVTTTQTMQDKLNKPKEPEKPASTMDKINTGAKYAATFQQAMLIWKYEDKPPVCNITANACSGAKNVKLRIFPANPAKVEFELKYLQEKLDKFFKLGKAVQMATTKLRIETKFEFLQGLSTSFEIGMKELTEKKNNRFPTEVHRYWTLKFSCEKILYLYAKAKLGLLEFVNCFFPGVGTILNEVANAAGIEINGYLSVSLQMSASFGGGIDEYDEGALNGTKAELVGIIEIGLEASYNGSLGTCRAWACIRETGTIALENFRRSENKEVLWDMDLTGQLVVTGEVGYMADLFNWNAVSRATIGVKKNEKKSADWIKCPPGDPPPMLTVLHMPVP